MVQHSTTLKQVSLNGLSMEIRKEMLWAVLYELAMIRRADGDTTIRHLKMCACMGPLPDCPCTIRERLIGEFIELAERTTEEPDPCPKCGKAFLRYVKPKQRYYVMCNCRIAVRKETKIEAIEAWDRLNDITKIEVKEIGNHDNQAG